jgi:hypothetical protein
MLMLWIFGSRCVWAFIGLALLSPPLSAQKRSLGLDTTSTAERYADVVGQSITFVCPASDGGPAYVYGTDVYTDNSPICKAAIHAGALPRGTAGVVTIVIGGAADAFRGSTRHGVTTSSYHGWPRSYRFVRDAASGGITWDTVWSNVPAGMTTAIVVKCPPQGSARGMVWGTTVYAGGSAICATAVHAGVITADRGGLLQVTRSVHTGEFVASERNGVASQKYGVFGDAFRVTAVTPLGAGERTIARGRTVADEMAFVGPRNIQVAGFSGTGTAFLGARSLLLQGWTASGTETTNSGSH